MIKTLACFGLVQPLLEHAAMVWDPSTDINIRKIEMVQRQATCSVVRNENRTDSVGAILDEMGWKSLQGRRKALRLCMLHKLHYGNLAADGMPQLIPMWRTSRQLNLNAY